MVHQAKRWLSMLMVLALCLSIAPVSSLAATTENGSSVTELGTGSYAITLKNDCDVAVKYSVTAGEATDTVTLAGNEALTLRGDAGEAYSVTWQGGAELTCSEPAQTTKSGTFGQAPAGYDGFDGYDGNAYTTSEVSNATLTCQHNGLTYTPDFYYVLDSVISFYSGRLPQGLYTRSDGTQYWGINRQTAREKALKDNGVDPTESDRYYNYEKDSSNVALWVYWKATPYLTFTSEVVSEFTLTLVNDCDASVQYQVTIGSDTQTVTLAANAQQDFSAVKDTPYTITWVGGTDSSYAYVTPTVTEYSGVFGVNTKTVYYLDGAEYNGQVSDTVSYNKYTMSAGTLYAVDTLKIFTRSKGTIYYTYTNINDSGESYSATSAAGARDNIMASHSGYTLVADGSDLGYAWVFKPVTTGTVSEIGNSTVTVTATAVDANHTGTFKVAALNVDGMPQSVKIAKVYDLKLNEDGPGASGSVTIGQYIERSGIDLLALSENFNFFQEINSNAPSYATMTQRERIPTEVGLGDLNNSLFPFDTDGLNLMYKNNLTVSSESMTAWNEHYSPTTNYVVVDVPDQNGADGMIDKGFRFYQVQMAPGVVVDVYILHMDAETDPGDNAARESQIDQLLAAVEANDNGNPIIIMGDTNCRYTRDPLESTIIAAGFSDPWIDLEKNGIYPQVGENALMVGDLGYQEGEVVDKVFYKNAEDSNVQLKAIQYFVDAEGYTDDGGLLGDHPPVIVTFEYSFTSSTVEHEHEWSAAWSGDAGYHWHECTADGCTISMNSQKDGYAAHTFTENVTKEPTCTETGLKTLTCSVCGYETTEVIPATGHRWDNGKVTTEPTATTDGVKTYTCTVCQATYTETIPATGAHASYTFEVRLDKEDYNVGDTATAAIYVKSADEGANFGTVGFQLSVPTGLTFQTVTSDLTGGQFSIVGGNYAYNVNSSTPVFVTSEGVKLATATFTVNGDFEGQNTTATVSLANAELTELKQNIPAESTTAPDSATLYRTYTVTFTAGEHVNMDMTSVTVRTGTTFGSITKPSYTLETNYTFDGWYNGDTLMMDDTAITGDITVTAMASAKQFSFTQTTNNAAIEGLTGVTDGKATYGTDITFTVAPSSGYVISGVSYTVDKGAATPLTAVNGTYTIPGSAITGNIAVEVTVTEYHTVTFVAGDGVNMTSATAYVKDGQSALYTDTDFDTLFTVPTPTAQTGYRLAKDDATEPLWSDGTNKYQTPALGSSVYFTTDATLTAQAVKVWNVTFAAGDHGTLSSTVPVVVDNNNAVPSDKIPAVTADTGYTFTGWDNNVGEAITADTTFTAQYQNATYTLSLSAVNGVRFAVEGAVEQNGVYTVTYDTDVTITMTAADNVNVTGVSYTIGNGQPVEVEDFTQPFTIDGEDITGNISVTVQAVNTYQITVTVEGGNGTVNGNESDTLTFDYNTPAEDVAKAFNIVANPGYTFTAPSYADVTGNATYTVTFTHATYTVNGLDGVDSATHGTDLIFIPNLQGKLLLGVQYQVGDGEAVTLEPNEDGSYTIPGDAITGPITVTYDTVAGSLTYIAETDYMAAPSGKKVAVLNTAKLEEGTYALNGYGDMFWSDRYSAYVFFVANDETDATLTEKLAVSNNSVTVIDYSGDTNGTGSVTPADSAAINAVLHSIQVEYEISDLMRFQFDVNGDKAVTAQDIKWILDTYTGASK